MLVGLIMIGVCIVLCMLFSAFVVLYPEVKPAANDSVSGNSANTDITDDELELANG